MQKRCKSLLKLKASESENSLRGKVPFAYSLCPGWRVSSCRITTATACFTASCLLRPLSLVWGSILVCVIGQRITHHALKMGELSGSNAEQFAAGVARAGDLLLGLQDERDSRHDPRPRWGKPAPTAKRSRAGTGSI